MDSSMALRKKKIPCGFLLSDASRVPNSPLLSRMLSGEILRNCWTKTWLYVLGPQLFQSVSFGLRFVGKASVDDCHGDFNSEFLLVKQNFITKFSPSWTAEPRFKLGAELADASGIIKATLFQKVAEKFLKHTAAEISKMDPEQLQALPIGAEAEAKDKEFIAQIRKTTINYTDGISRYTVQACFSTERLL